MIPFLIDFYRFWRPLGPQVGPMLRPCWPQNPQKSTLENKAKKKTSKIVAGRSRSEWGMSSWGPLNEQKTTLSGNYRKRKHALAASAVADMYILEPPVLESY